MYLVQYSNEIKEGFVAQMSEISFLIYDVESSNELCNLNKIYSKYLKTNCLIFVKKRSLNPDKINILKFTNNFDQFAYQALQAFKVSINISLGFVLKNFYGSVRMIFEDKFEKKMFCFIEFNLQMLKLNRALCKK
ncbi:hypothetical protein BpHYR1_044951 [Brachionus plicatilis]|uniref:Uncharacterized protein n=1 Tax=Brachionus plicatilis TaxID=10195 RepID=A0A3M7S061_BRAPC|nr:hypothetical protein BpHYR1_044951 [Brachionus plicatilis]